MVSAPDIPGHKVAGIVGTGGFATVYRSWQIAVGREVAVKVDNRVLLSDRDRRRFVREVTAAGRLSGHPHVIDVYDAGTLADGRPYLVMEFCPAGSLNDLLRRRGPMSAGQVRDIGIRIADALAAAHAAGILHRDIKPANILINRYGMVGLSDFGLASILAAEGEQSATREALTPAYAPPESFRSEEPTTAADLYSLAATLYALLAGRPPRFPSDGRSPSPAAIMLLHNEPVEDVPGAPPELMELLRRCLAGDPGMRPPSAVALRDALVALTARPARPAGPPAQTAPPAGVPAGDPVPAGHSRPGRHSSRGPASASAHPAGTDHPPTVTALGRRGPAGPGPDGFPARRAPAAGPGGRGRRVMTAVAVTVGLVLVIGTSAVVGARLLSHSASSGPGQATSPGGPGPVPAAAAAPGVLGIATVTRGCPAASVRAAAARCPAAPECWNGIVEVSGNVTAASLPCTVPHTWQTFAIAILPADAQTYDAEIVQANPAVRAVCSMRVMLRSRLLLAHRFPVRSWEIQVMPPDQASFGSGARAYRCLAARIGASPATSEFRP